jgi:hypothetical protein
LSAGDAGEPQGERYVIEGRSVALLTRAGA